VTRVTLVTLVTHCDTCDKYFEKNWRDTHLPTAKLVGRH
jgi:hypothetical protein